MTPPGDQVQQPTQSGPVANGASSELEESSLGAPGLRQRLEPA